MAVYLEKENSKKLDQTPIALGNFFQKKLLQLELKKRNHVS